MSSDLYSTCSLQGRTGTVPATVIHEIGLQTLAMVLRLSAESRQRLPLAPALPPAKEFDQARADDLGLAVRGVYVAISAFTRLRPPGASAAPEGGTEPTTVSQEDSAGSGSSVRRNGASGLDAPSVLLTCECWLNARLRHSLVRVVLGVLILVSGQPSRPVVLSGRQDAPRHELKHTNTRVAAPERPTFFDTLTQMESRQCRTQGRSYLYRSKDLKHL
jgi:hypothetical protein